MQTTGATALSGLTAGNLGFSSGPMEAPAQTADILKTSIDSEDMVLDLTCYARNRVTDSPEGRSKNDLDVDMDDNEENVGQEKGVLNVSQLAGMNFNSNGHPDSQLRNLLEQGDFLKKVKHINMGEVPLEPMGLSLSGSGMQLYVKMDADIQKAILRQTLLKNAPKTKKAQKTRKQKLSKVNQETPQFPEVDMRTDVKTAEPEREKNCLRSSLPPIRSVSKHAEDNPAKHGPDSAFLQPASPVSLPADRGAHSDAQTKPTEQSSWSNLPSLKRKPSDMGVLSDPAKVVTSKDDWTPSRRSHGNKHTVYPVISGPSWRVENGNIDVSSSKATRKQSCRGVRSARCPRTPPVSVWDGAERECENGFTSDDLPLGRPRSPSARHYGKEEDDDNDDDYDDERSKYRRRYVRKCRERRHKRICKHRRASSERHYSSDNDSKSGEQDWRMKEYDSDDSDDLRIVSVEAPRKRRASTGQRHRCLNNNPDLRPVKREPQSEGRGSQLSHHVRASLSRKSSVGPDFDVEELSKRGLNTEMLTKFTQYTKNMRKDLRNSYRNLSDLMKDFNEAVLHHNNNHIDEKKSNKTLDEDEAKNGRCLIM